MNRRRLMLAALCAAAPDRAVAADLAYKSWTFVAGSGVGALPEATVQSLQAQADLVDSLPIKPDIQAFFHTVRLEIDATTAGGAGEYSFDRHRLFLSLKPDNPANPVFLHELLHAYHDLRLPGGRRNPQIRAFYDQAVAAGAFEDRSYMLSNVVEFFAMCTSVALWGRAARAPFTRANVQANLPQFYSWIVAEFYPNGAAPS